MAPMRRAFTFAVVLLAPACSSSSNEDSTGPTSTPTCTIAATLDAGFTSLSQVCSTTADPSFFQDACGPYVIVTPNNYMVDSWYFDAQSGALVAVITGTTCVTTSSTFASQWGVQAWGCATATPLCTADAGTADAPHD